MAFARPVLKMVSARRSRRVQIHADPIMTPLTRIARPLLTAFLTVTLVFVTVRSVSAVSISGNFFGGEQKGPSIGGGNIVDIFEAAAAVWEMAIRDDFSVSIDYGWGPNPGGYHFLLAQGGTPNRETHGLILVNPQVFSDGAFITLFMDPTPTLHEEFPTFNEMTQDLGGGAVNTGRILSAPLEGAQFQDLFTVLAHEIGHALGTSNANTSFMAQAADGDIDVTAPLAFAGTTIPLAFNNFGVTSHVDPDLPGPLMASHANNERRLPSQLSGFSDLNLDLAESVPEPPTLVLVGSGFVIVVAAKWPRRRRSRAGGWTQFREIYALRNPNSAFLIPHLEADPSGKSSPVDINDPEVLLRKKLP